LYKSLSQPPWTVFWNRACLPLFVYKKNFKGTSNFIVFIFFSKFELPNRGCGLSTGAAYTWNFTVVITLLLQCISFVSYTHVLYDSWSLVTLELFVERYFCFVTECKNPKACTILLRGPSKDILNEVFWISSYQEH